MPAESYSEAARDFVRGCLNKIPKLRPAYAMLIRHGWLAPLMKPPTIHEDDEAEVAAEAGHNVPPGGALPETADKEVADWVQAAIERKISGKMAQSEKPALHAAPLDAVPRNPMVAKESDSGTRAVNGPAETEPEPESNIAPGEGVKVDGSELERAQVESTDFAGGLGGKEDAAIGDTAEPETES